eukprot:10922496-Alexandrium_andersonii.AAC.1
MGPGQRRQGRPRCLLGAALGGPLHPRWHVPARERPPRCVGRAQDLHRQGCAGRVEHAADLQATH